MRGNACCVTALRQGSNVVLFLQVTNETMGSPLQVEMTSLVEVFCDQDLARLSKFRRIVDPSFIHLMLWEAAEVLGRQLAGSSRSMLPDIDSKELVCYYCYYY